MYDNSVFTLVPALARRNTEIDLSLLLMFFQLCQPLRFILVVGACEEFYFNKNMCGPEFYLDYYNLEVILMQGRIKREK